MDRDVSISMTTALTNIKNILNTLATNTTPTTADNRSISSAPVENQRSVPAEAPEEEPEADPEEPETRTKK